MRNEFTAIIERDGPWYVLQHRREESLRSIPPDAAQELVIVGGSATGSSATCGGLRKLSVPDPPG
jgi:hypothetical protein